MNTYPIYDSLHFRDRRDAASLRYRNHAKITVSMLDQKPYPVEFFVPAQELSNI